MSLDRDYFLPLPTADWSSVRRMMTDYALNKDLGGCDVQSKCLGGGLCLISLYYGSSAWEPFGRSIRNAIG